MYPLIFLKDFYKAGHYEQYPYGTTLIFSNFTPRKSMMPGVNHSVFFGLKYLINNYLRPSIISEYENCWSLHERYKSILKETTLISSNFEHIDSLLSLSSNYSSNLPIAIYALPEGSVVPCGVPAMVVFNTHPKFYWVTNMIETILSCTLWGACTSATIAREYRLLLDYYAKRTSDIPEFVDYQAHDFSFRGMFGLEAALISGAAHLQYFKGTDTLPAIIFNEDFNDVVAHLASVPATEHSVMSAGGKDNELETYRRLITKVYPSGIVSIVSDTWDLWNVINNILPILRNEIMNRNGKIVIRPDSGDPVDIICGSQKIVYGYSSEKGLIECLWDIFGGTVNSKGYKQLDPHIGAIYGDSITWDRCKEICDRLQRKGFASTNIVFGLGSYTYQYNTRDTLGWAMKATYAEINGEGRAITKNPVTDNGTKKSHSGLLKVIKNDKGEFEVKQNVTWEDFYQDDNELKLAFKDGVTYL